MNRGREEARNRYDHLLRNKEANLMTEFTFKPGLTSLRQQQRPIYLSLQAHLPRLQKMIELSTLGATTGLTSPETGPIAMESQQGSGACMPI
jgi:hypothetical protein